MARPWQVVFVLYAIVLTTATHWPALELGTAQQPAPDKLLHLVAFAALALLLGKTAWLARPWQAAVVAMAWAAVDELSQILPGLHRTFSWADMVAGQLGVVLVGAWWWALAPIGGAANRMRLAYQSFVLSVLLVRPVNTIIAAASAAAGAAVIGGATWAVLRVTDSEPDNLAASLFVAAAAGAVGGAHVVVAGMCRRRAEAMAGVRPCFACGGSCTDAAFDESGIGRCPTCGGAIHRGQWSPPMDLPLSVATRGAFRAAASAIGLLASIALLFWLVLVGSVHLTAARRLVQTWEQQPSDMQLAVDLAVVGIVVAVAIRMYRGLQAKIQDRQHERCRHCGHDLTGTEAQQGIGRCGECGQEFVRLSNA